MKIGIGIITYNRISCLQECIESIRSTDRSLLSKIIVADDGSEDASPQWLKNQPDLIPILGKKNIGIARNSNRALRMLRDVDFGFLINDDIRFNKPGWVREYVNAMLLTPYKHFVFMGGKNGINLIKVEKINNIEISFHNASMGSFLTFSKEVLNQVGGFDSRFGKYGLEHVEWSIRIGQAGLSHPFDYDNQTAEKIKVLDIANSLEYISDIHQPSVFTEQQKLQHSQEANYLFNEIRRQNNIQKGLLARPFIAEENAK